MKCIFCDNIDTWKINTYVVPTYKCEKCNSIQQYNNNNLLIFIAIYFTYKAQEYYTNWNYYSNITVIGSLANGRIARISGNPITPQNILSKLPMILMLS